MSIVVVPKRLREDVLEFKTHLDYIETLSSAEPC